MTEFCSTPPHGTEKKVVNTLLYRSSTESLFSAPRHGTEQKSDSPLGGFLTETPFLMEIYATSSHKAKGLRAA